MLLLPFILYEENTKTTLTEVNSRSIITILFRTSLRESDTKIVYPSLVPKIFS